MIVQLSIILSEFVGLYFKFTLIALPELVDIVEGYRQRTYNEDLIALSKLGGKNISS